MWRIAAVVATILALGGLGLLTSSCLHQQEAAPTGPPSIPSMASRSAPGPDVTDGTRGAVPSEGLTICAAQTELRLYSTTKEFQAHMSQRIAAAAGTGAQLVVLPEDIGAPLAMIAGYSDVKTAATLAEAMRILVHKYAAHIDQFLRVGISPARALLLACAPQMHEVYTTTFSRLAAKHHVWIAAGSIPLPEVSLGDAQDVFNLAFLFAPDGHIAGFIPKVNLIELEQAAGLDLTPGELDEVNPLPTPLGVLGLLICADAWDPAVAERLVSGGAQILVNPAANPKPWTEEEQAANRQGLFSRCQELLVWGVQCFAVGQLFDLSFEGQSCIIGPQAWTPDGSGILAQAKTCDSEELLVATLNWDDLAARLAATGDK